MVFRNICYFVGFIGGCVLIIYGVRARGHTTQKSTWASLVIAGGCSVIWSVLGEMLYWFNVVTQGYDLVRMLIAGIAAGILVNMVLSGQINALKVDLLRNRVVSANRKKEEQ
jgi:hypothetical protein